MNISMSKNTESIDITQVL